VVMLSNNIYTFLIPLLRRTKRRSIVDQGRTTETEIHSKPDSVHFQVQEIYFWYFL
jgi:hypothetical protein